MDMDKGIRVNVNIKFNELLPQLGEGMSNKVFRKTVMAYAIAEFNISIAAAASHYNHALKRARELTPALVKDLGRPPK
jgi:hypothetical protein